MRERIRLRHFMVTLAILAIAWMTSGAQPAHAAGTLVQVFRCYNKINGAHLYTAGDSEALSAVRKYPKVYAYEGPVYWAYLYDDPADPQDIPLYRFYNKLNGTHFYTISAEEKAFVEANYRRTYTYEGVAYAVSQQGKPVYRFYNKKNGSHFYTISLEEKAHVEATWPDVFTYEGVAFYAMESLLTIGPVYPSF